MKRVSGRIVRVTTVPGSLRTFCKGLLGELHREGYDIVAVSSPGEDLDAVGRDEGVRTVVVPMRRDIAPRHDVVSLWRMVRVLRRERPVMVHSMTPKAGLVAMAAAWLCRVPVRVHTFTGLVFPTATGMKRRLLMLTDRLTCAFATHVIPEGQGVLDDLRDNGITRKPMRVLGHGNVRGIDPEHYSPRAPGVEEAAATLRRRGTVTFVFIGRLVGDKGINELVGAFTELHRRHSGTRLVLVGAPEAELDPLHPDTIAAVASHPAIEAVGRQDDVRPYLAAADVLAFPSYREGFPNVVIEAGAMGLPAVVTDINGSREIIAHGVNGLIVPPRDTAALLQAMERMVLDPGMRRDMGLKARPMVVQRYEQGYVRRCLKEFYASVMPQL